MTYPCGIIKDLLPLYIDNVCNEESKIAVENHLPRCEKCREYYESMKSTDGFEANQNYNVDDVKIVNILKNVKLRINKKIRNIILCSVTAVLVFVLAFYVLFNTAIKEVDFSDVSVSANVYSLEELAASSLSGDYNSASVTIYSDENDKSESVNITIPELGVVSLTENTMEKNGYVTVISMSSKYFLRTIKQETKGDIIYISAFKTTLLNNKAGDYQKTMTSLEFNKINKIVFVENNGKETVLWENN